GIDLNENPDHHHEMEDIRFAGLAGLKAQLEAEQGE
ncbi:DNA-binding protein, partial [Bifidobacterium breve]